MKRFDATSGDRPLPGRAFPPMNAKRPRSAAGPDAADGRRRVYEYPDVPQFRGDPMAPFDPDLAFASPFADRGDEADIAAARMCAMQTRWARALPETGASGRAMLSTHVGVPHSPAPPIIRQNGTRVETRSVLYERVGNAVLVIWKGWIGAMCPNWKKVKSTVREARISTGPLAMGSRTH